MGYRFRQQAKAEWSKEYEDVRKPLTTRMTGRDAPFHLRQVGEGSQWGPWRSRLDARKRLIGHMEGGKTGEVWEIENENGWRMKVRRTADGIDRIIPSWAGVYLQSTNDRINTVASASYAFDEGVDCLGSKVCKHILGSSSWSQHAYGNAIDLAFRIPPPTGFDMPRQDRLANFLVTHADELALEHVIHRDRAWTRGSGWGSYGGEYHTHVHVDCYPQGTGYPPGC